jgi:hypothetical protein
VQGRLTLPCVPLTQLAFNFVSSHDRQQMAVNYEEHAQRVLKRILRRASVPIPELGDVRIDILEQPLFASVAHDPPAGVDGSLEFDEADEPGSHDEFSCSEEEKQEHIEWIAEHAHQFIGFVMDRAMDVLASHGNAREKAHIIEWMFAADIAGYLHYEDQFEDEKVELKRPVFSVDVPMTFQWCCKVFGLRVDEYQERILDALKEAVAHSRDRENQGQLRRSQYQVYQAAHNLAAAL